MRARAKRQEPYSWRKKETDEMNKDDDVQTDREKKGPEAVKANYTHFVLFDFFQDSKSNPLKPSLF